MSQEKINNILFAVVILLFILALFLLARTVKKRFKKTVDSNNPVTPVTPVQSNNIQDTTVDTRDHVRDFQVPFVRESQSMPDFNHPRIFTLIQPTVNEDRVEQINPLRQFLLNIRAGLDHDPAQRRIIVVNANLTDDGSETETETEQPVRDRTAQTHEEFIDDITRNNHGNDSQNVHNSYINIALSRKYNRLYELHSEQNEDEQIFLKELDMNITEFQENKIATAIREIRDWAQTHIRNKYGDGGDGGDGGDILEERKFNAVLSEIEKGYSITSVSNAVDDDGNSIAIAEDWILTLTWERIHASDNVNVQEQLKEALYDQLVDGAYCLRKRSLGNDLLRVFFGHIIDDDADADADADADDNDPENIIVKPVCINGRVGRVLSSFTLIDTDPVLSEPEKDEKEISNEAYTKVNHILNQSLENYAKRVNMTKESLKDLYDKVDEDLSSSEQEVVLGFRENAKKEIAETLKTDYENLIDEKLLFNITQQAVSVV